jgi:hypothetical protein
MEGSSVEIQWSFVKLTMAGEYLDPEEVTAILGIEPDSRAKRGESHPHFRNTPKQGFWSLTCDQVTSGYEMQMKAMLERITPSKERLERLLREDTSVTSAHLVIVCQAAQWLASVGLCLPSDLVSEFSSMGIDIAVTIYMPFDDDDSDDAMCADGAPTCDSGCDRH